MMCRYFIVVVFGYLRLNASILPPEVAKKHPCMCASFSILSFIFSPKVIVNKHTLIHIVHLLKNYICKIILGESLRYIHKSYK